MTVSPDFSQVADLIRDVAATELLPRFRNLSKDDVRQKRPDDFVTVADVASEQRLASGLAKILPGVPVVGEEAVEDDAGLLDLIGRPGEMCWIVDPLDGTANFAAGKATFAIIVALVADRRTIGGWIFDVPNGRMAIARAGQGVTLDGATVVGAPSGASSAGFVGYRIRKAFERQLPAVRGLGPVSTLRCAGIEYLEILAGRATFSIYRRTKPWDHAAGALILAEAGGGAVRFDGADYAPAQPIDAGIIGAPSQRALADVRAAFEALELPLLQPEED
ncbi:MAG: inositol monophosphatase family protein [Reyranella sp.]|uniref:inositol monophosphatase family protein n=1 Tax=Reyranella sp. TaxID=1929291 RepID=UPI002730BB2F|nr:inositol monophosphatase family protein [Reyranella sp.]MDP1960699.1 inositol monophosphatase family protein [Reyranella sp.]MDP2373978.1 inositol monophosphatase family protein [Reyranella sp.]